MIRFKLEEKTTPKRYQKLEFQTLKDTTSTPTIYHIRTPLGGAKELSQTVTITFIGTGHQRRRLRTKSYGKHFFKIKQPLFSYTHHNFPIKRKDNVKGEFDRPNSFVYQ